MNKSRRLISNSICITIFAFFSNTSLCQSQTLHFDNTTLYKVIETLEENSDYVFNYNPEFLKEYYYSGLIDITDLYNSLSNLFYNSPYTFEVEKNTVLIFRAEQKSYRLCGSVKDFQTKEPLIGSNISAELLLEGSQSDLDGYFDFNITSDKNQIIEISYLGYETISFMVQDLRENDCPVYKMKIDQDLLGDEIVITGYILDGIVAGTSFGGVELDFDQLSKNHSNVEHDILKTAQLLPGITSIDDSATNLQIRGSSPDQNLILWEGAPVYNAGHIFGMISAINPFSTSRVNIYKGAHDPKYDNRVGGIIDISLTDSIDNNFKASLGTTLTEVHANLDIPLIKDHVSFLISGRQSLNGIYSSPPLQSYTDKVFQYSVIDDQKKLVEEGGLDSDQSLDYNDWNAKLLYQASDHINMSLGVYSNQQNFKYSISFPGNPDQQTDKIGVNTQAINGNVDFKINNLWTSSLSLHSSEYENAYTKDIIEDGIFKITFDQFNRIRDRSLRFSNAFMLSKRFNVNAGYEFNTKEVDLRLADDSFVSIKFEDHPDEIGNFHNLFLSSGYAHKKIKVDFGLRTTYYQEYEKWENSPRINIQYSINDHLKLKADGGIYHQFISQLNDFGTDQITRDNPLWVLNSSDVSLSQKANKIAAGFLYRQNGWLIDIDAFYNRTDGLSTISPGLRLLPGVLSFSKGHSVTKGVDFLLKKKWAGFNTWINYSLGAGNNYFPDITENPFSAPNDIRHNLNLIASYRIKKIQFSLNAKYQSGLPYSFPIVRFNPEETELPFRYPIDYEEFNNLRLKSYLRIDLSANYRTSLKRLGNLRTEISMSLINLLNDTNVVAREHYIDYDAEVFVPEPTFIQKELLGITPLVLVRFYY